MKIISASKFCEELLSNIMNRGVLNLSSVKETVKKIVDSVKREGDKALIEYTAKFDGVDLTEIGLKVHEEEISRAYECLDESELRALEEASENIKFFHKAQLSEGFSVAPFEGVTIGQKYVPLSSVGVYAPGGKKLYPSTVLMCAIPAKLVGVKDLILCSPPSKSGKVNPRILVAADLSSVTDVFRIGGAQAIAAMAYGTESIPKVEKIVGPGNIYVTAAKLEVSREVAIDLPAGPTEIVIIADGNANEEYVALDLLAQAEHDENALVILLTNSKSLAEKVNNRISTLLRRVDREETVWKSLKNNGFIVLVKDLEEAVKLSNLIAPEHVEILTENPDEVFKGIRNAGAVFLGEFSPVALGDYTSGLNHVLPTGGYARVYSGLSIRDFIKSVNFLRCTPMGFKRLKRSTVKLALMEDLRFHAESVDVRSEEDED